MEGVIVSGMPYLTPGLLFADDVVIFAASENDLRNKIKIIEKWSVENRMKINSQKCGILKWSTNDGNRNLKVATVFGTSKEIEEYT